MICKYCNKQIGKHLTQETHMCKSKKIYKKTLHIHPDVIKKINEGYSVLYLSKHSQVLFDQQLTYWNILAICRWYDVITPNSSESASSQYTQNMTKKTMNERYGVDNASQSQEIKNKKQLTNLTRYGVDNPFQREEIKKKSRETMIKKYGVINACQLPKKSNNGRLSRPHKKISDALTAHNIAHENDQGGLFSKFNHTLNRIYSPIPDIYIPDKNIVIEIFGDRWHMNPLFYKETDIVRFFVGDRSGKETWEHDKLRTSHIKSFGVNLLIIWEHDIKTSFTDTVKKVIDFYENC